ncbi:MAG TPA: hypothetical protein VHK91_05750 [Flavisolibacter sp.]|jgi:hypothetical protein|nr:hypothetical protein [Flavisolibacter sp.]
MKATTLTLIILAMLSVFSSCKKDPVSHPAPGPGNGAGQSFQYRFVIENLVSVDPEGSFAIASVENQQGQEVIRNKKLPLTYKGQFESEILELPAGSYRLTKWIVFGKNGKVQQAAPLAGSEKATSVSKPLKIGFRVPNADTLRVGVQVAGVNPGEAPSKFGYPADAFGDSESHPDPNPDFTIQLRTVIANGNVIYDSIPSTLRVTIWDEKNEFTTRDLHLAPGTNTIALPKAATKFKFQIWQWGHTDEMTLLRKDVDANTVYLIGGGREAKKLKSELVYTLVDGTYRADSKTVYNYGANGKLDEILYYLKRKDGTPYIAFTDLFLYDGDRVEAIVKSDEKGNAISSTAFEYNTQGQVIAMRQKDAGTTETAAEVTYTPVGNAQRVTIRYRYSDNSNVLYYNKTLLRGNMIETSAASDLSSETGYYRYDFQINPYANMNWPDLYLSHQVKNNVIEQQKSYSGHYPTADPYKFDYKYDDQGYPVELIKSYKSPVTGQHLFITKTVFTY